MTLREQIEDAIAKATPVPTYPFPYGTNPSHTRAAALENENWIKVLQTILAETAAADAERDRLADIGKHFALCPENQRLAEIGRLVEEICRDDNTFLRIYPGHEGAGIGWLVKGNGQVANEATLLAALKALKEKTDGTR